MIREAIALAALDLLTGIGIVLVLATVAFVIAEVRREDRLPPEAPVEEAEQGESDWEWPAQKVGPTAEPHLGKPRLPDSERRRAA